MFYYNMSIRRESINQTVSICSAVTQKCTVKQMLQYCLTIIARTSQVYALSQGIENSSHECNFKQEENLEISLCSVKDIKTVTQC